MSLTVARHHNSPLRLLMALFCLCLPAKAGAQSRYEETLEVRLMEIDARVVDRKGEPVHGLTAADFVLREDGKIVDIESVFEVRRPKRPDPAGQETPEGETEKGAAMLSPSPRPRTIVFFLDQLPLNSNLRSELFADLHTFAAAALRDGDSAAIVGWALEAKVIVPLTANRSRIIGTFESIARDLDSIPGTMPYDAKNGLTTDLSTLGVGGGGRSVSAGWDFDVEEEGEIFAGVCAEEILAETRRKVAAMKSIVSSLQGNRSAIFVYVSNRIPENTQVYCNNLGVRSRGGGRGHPLYSATGLIRSLASTANAAGVTLYSLRPHVPKTMPNATESGLPSLGTAGARDSLLVSNELSSLGRLAEATGGLVGYSPKEIESTLSTIVSDLDTYYSVGYRTTSSGKDRERKIRLEAKNHAYTVRARTALVDRSDLTRTKDRLVANLYGIDDPGEIVVGARVVSDVAKRKRRRIKVELRFRPSVLTFIERNGKEIATYRLLILSSNRIGTLSELEEETKTLEKSAMAGDSPVALKFDLETEMEGTLTAIGIMDETTGIAGFTTLDTR